jgi:hypothetical protein
LKELLTIKEETEKKVEKEQNNQEETINEVKATITKNKLEKEVSVV